MDIADQLGPLGEVKAGTLGGELVDHEPEHAIERDELLQLDDEVEQIGVGVDSQRGGDLRRRVCAHDVNATANAADAIRPARSR